MEARDSGGIVVGAEEMVAFAGQAHGDTIVRLPNGATMEFVWIEAGTFTMGSPSSEPGRFDAEGPQHEVTITQKF